MANRYDILIGKNREEEEKVDAVDGLINHLSKFYLKEYREALTKMCMHPAEFISTDSEGNTYCKKCLEEVNECSKGGPHVWGTDGAHSNVYCKKCFKSK